VNYHGYDVTTEILGYYTDQEECKKAALEFSESHNIVESAEWANLEIEDGLNGGFIGATGKKNTQFGTMWITDGTVNAKILKTDTIPAGWTKGRKVPDGWGDNIRQQLKGKTLEEIQGTDQAAIGRQLRSRTRAQQRHAAQAAING
jgi:hypothetical protein